MRLALCLITICLSGQHSATAEEGWPQFRGPNGSGVAQSAHPPQKFGRDENMLWKTEIPPGLSSPIVTESRVFITAKLDDQLVTLAYDTASGRELWRRAAPAETIEKTHEFSSPAAATPCTDGKRIFTCFNSFGAVAYGLDGKEVWQRELPTVATRYGSASSPVVIDGKVILQRDGGSANSQILALDPATGKTLWEIPRTPAGGAHSTPMVWQHRGLNELMVLGAGRLAALDPGDGKTRWWVKGWGFAAITTPVANSEMLFVGGGGTGDPSEPLDPLFNWPKLLADYDANKDEQLAIAEVPESLGLHIRKDVPREAAGNYMPLRSIMSTFMDQDKDKKISKAEWDATLAFMTDRNNGDLFAAVRPGGHDDATKTHVAWVTTKALPEMPSPLLYNDRLYLMKSGGLLSMLEPKSGKRLVDRKRLAAGGLYVASPIAAAGHIYVANDDGTITVLRAGDTLEVASQNALGETIRATPAIAGSTLFVRTDKHLWAFGEKKAAHE